MAHKIVETFAFSSERKPAKATFSGSQFYNTYKYAHFLKDKTNVESILSRGFELRQKLAQVPDGRSIVVEGMYLEKSTPLKIKKTAKGIVVKDYEFTYNRLVGLVAAYTYENRSKFPDIEASEAKALGLVWDNQRADKCKLYLSALSGSEHMLDQFSYWPLVCGLRKYQLDKLPIELVVKMAKIKNAGGESMIKLFNENLETVKRLWITFPEASLRDINVIFKTPQLKKMLVKC